MSAALVTRQAEHFIQAMHLPPQDQEIVRRSCVKYIRPENFCDFLSWVVGLIVDLVKPLFCISRDIDVATELVKVRALQIAVENKCYYPVPENAEQERKNGATKQILNRVVETLLGNYRFSVGSRGPLPLTAEEIRNRAAILDLERITKELASQ